MMWNNMETYYWKYANNSDVGSHAEAICLTGFIFFVTFVQAGFRNLWGGTPLDRFWKPLGHPWSDFVDCLEDFRSSFA